VLQFRHDTAVSGLIREKRVELVNNAVKSVSSFGACMH
jgi:hypothetical protein